MKTRFVMAVILIAFLGTGCESATSEPLVTIAPIEPRPAEQEVTTAPIPPPPPCGDLEASLRPTPPLPPPGAMPPDSTMEAIVERGDLIVGVDQNTHLFGFRNPLSGELEGFDIDLAREIAYRIFGDPSKIKLRVVDASEREEVLQPDRPDGVDLVVRTYSITCDRKARVAFSTVYYRATQRILAREGFGIDPDVGIDPDAEIDSFKALSGKRVCVVSGTTSLSMLLAHDFDLDPKPKLIGVASWTDCLVMLQQGQVDAISTDDAVLAGLKTQDPTLVIVGGPMGDEPYGIGMKGGEKNEDLVRFVNGVLDQMRVDGTWERLYRHWLFVLGPSPGPPSPRYQN